MTDCCRCWRRSSAPPGTLFIVAEDVDGRSAVHLGREQDPRHLHVGGCQGPAFGDRRKAMLEDIAILTGGKVVAPGGWSQARPGWSRRPGSCSSDCRDQGQHHDRRRCRRQRRSQGPGVTAEAEIARTDSDWDREKLQERVAKLAGGVCVIKVGAATEWSSRKEAPREDAVSRPRVPRSRGVAGGGSALIHAAAL